MEGTRFKLFALTIMLLMVLSVIIAGCGSKEPAASNSPVNQPIGIAVSQADSDLLRSELAVEVLPVQDPDLIRI